MENCFLFKPIELNNVLCLSFIKPLKNLLSVNQYIRRYKDKLVLGILFVFLSNLFRVFQPQIIRKALDKIISFLNSPAELRNPNELTQELMKFGLIVLGCAALMGLFMYFMRQTIIVMSRLIEYDQRKDIFKHYLTLDTSFFKTNKTGDIMSRISEDVNKVRMYLGPAFLYGFNLISLFIVVIFTMFKVNFWLSIYTLAPLPLLSLIIYKVSNLINKRSERIQRQLAKITSVAQEGYSGIRIIKAFNIQPLWQNYFNKETLKHRRLSLDLAQVDAMFFPAMALMVGFSTLITIYIGGLSVFEGTVSAGNIAEFVIYINMLTWPVSAIGWCASIIQQAEASQARINEFLGIQPSIKDKEDSLSSIQDYSIEFRNVSFLYPENQVKALENIQLKIPHGIKLGIVGKTASGKSTLAELILRMYFPSQGEILLGNIPIEKYKINTLRSNIAYVPQDVFLFSDTIENNLLVGIPEESLEIAKGKLEEVCKIAGIHDEILSLSNGYQTIIGERGVTLSGGQKQRISIARALLMNANIFVFDDCLSAVDAITEESIFTNIIPMLKNKTLIIITHRVLQTKYLDQIVVIDNHQIVEQGKFEDLLDKGGKFAKMHQIESIHKSSALV